MMRQPLSEAFEKPKILADFKRVLNNNLGNVTGRDRCLMIQNMTSQLSLTSVALHSCPKTTVQHAVAHTVYRWQPLLNVYLKSMS